MNIKKIIDLTFCVIGLSLVLSSLGAGTNSFLGLLLLVTGVVILGISYTSFVLLGKYKDEKDNVDVIPPVPQYSQPVQQQYQNKREEYIQPYQQPLQQQIQPQPQYMGRVQPQPIQQEKYVSKLEVRNEPTPTVDETLREIEQLKPPVLNSPSDKLDVPPLKPNIPPINPQKNDGYNRETLVCEICGKECQGMFGLQSHKRIKHGIRK